MNQCVQFDSEDLIARVSLEITEPLACFARDVDLYKDLTLKDLRRLKTSANARGVRFCPGQGRDCYPGSVCDCYPGSSATAIPGGRDCYPGSSSPI